MKKTSKKEIRELKRLWGTKLFKIIKKEWDFINNTGRNGYLKRNEEIDPEEERLVNITIDKGFKWFMNEMAPSGLILLNDDIEEVLDDMVFSEIIEGDEDGH